MYEHFAAVAELAPADQHRLLTHGDGPERLWAAWAIALKVGADAVPVLQRTDFLDAPSGLRCHLLVVLAGLGRRDLLRTIAAQDPSADVRTTATTYFIRTSPAPSDPESLTVALSALVSNTASLREAVLCEHEAGRIQIPDGDLIRLLKDASPSIRRLALACLLVKQPPSAAVTSALTDALISEEDPETAKAIFVSLPAEAICDLPRMLAAMPAARILTVLALLHQHEVRLEWAALEPLSRLQHSVVARSIVGLLPKDHSEPALLWVAERVAEAWTEPAAVNRHWRFIAYLERGLTPPIAKLLPVETRATLLAVFDDLLSSARRESDPYDYPERADEIARLEWCVHVLKPSSS